MQTSKAIGGVNEYRTLTGTKYRKKYFVLENDLSSYMPEIGSYASWAPVKAVVSGVTKTWMADGAYVLEITAEIEDADTAASSGVTVRTGSSVDASVEQDFSMTDLTFRDVWFGMRIAEADDCTPFINSTTGVIPDGKKKYMAKNGSWASPGDFIYLNAVPRVCEDGRIIESGSAGSASNSFSPFSESSIPETYFRQTVKVCFYRCSFNTKRSPAKLQNFIGVSGSFQNGCSPGGSPGNGKWKAVSQSIRSMHTSSGTKYFRVTRDMIGAPSGLTWSADRNGGTWKW